MQKIDTDKLILAVLIVVGLSLLLVFQGNHDLVTFDTGLITGLCSALFTLMRQNADKKE